MLIVSIFFKLILLETVFISFWNIILYIQYLYNRKHLIYDKGLPKHSELSKEADKCVTTCSEALFVWIKHSDKGSFTEMTHCYDLFTCVYNSAWAVEFGQQ